MPFVRFICTPANGPAGQKIEVSASKGVSAGRAMPRPSMWRSMGTVAHVAGVRNITTPYIAAFGNPIQGTTIHLCCWIITSDGQRSSPMYGTCVVQ